MNKILRVMTALILGCSLLVLLSILDLSFLKSEIVEYPILCGHKLTYGICSAPKFNLRRTYYKPSISRQEVLYWTEGFNVERLTKCAVRDRKNWSCKYDDGSAEIGFKDGRCFDHTLSPTVTVSDDVYYVSKLEWLNQQCKDSGLLYPLCLPLVSWISG